MAVFLDTGFLVALCHQADIFHVRATQLLENMSTGQFGLIYSSSYILDEAATLTLVRTNNNLTILQEFFSFFFGTDPFIELIPWSKEIEQETVTLFQQLNQKAHSKKEWLSFTDVSNLVCCQKTHIEYIATFDGHFRRFLTEIN